LTLDTLDPDHLGDHAERWELVVRNVNVRVCGSASKSTQCRGDSTETRTIFTMQWLYEDGATPFVRAAQSGDVTLMKLLLTHGADPKNPTAHIVTALAVASGIGWVEGVTFEWSPEETVEAVKMLLDLGLDPNAISDEGRTPCTEPRTKNVTKWSNFWWTTAPGSTSTISAAATPATAICWAIPGLR
jgi:hypothetical protein